MNVSWVTWKARRPGSIQGSLPFRHDSIHECQPVVRAGEGWADWGAIPVGCSGRGVEFGWDLEEGMILTQVEESKLILGYG